MFKKLISCLMLAITLFLCTIPINGIVEETPIFKDVLENHIYYEDIMYFVEQGVIKGKEDGFFHPDEFITVAEAITVIEKVFGEEKNLPKDWSWWSNPTYKDENGWTPDWYFPLLIIKGDYLTSANRNTISCILLNTVGQPIVKTEPWGMSSEMHYENSIYYLNMLIRGYWEDELKSYIGVSRAEFCNLLRWFENNQELPEPKPIYVDVEEKYLEKVEKKENCYYNVYSAIMQLPEKIQKLYTKKNGKFYLVDEKYWAKNFKNLDTASGVYFYKSYNNKIYVRDVDKRTIIHEFGHFLDYNFPKYLNKVKKIYEKDLIDGILMSFIKNDYCNTTVREYFADGFVIYITQPEELKENLPELYDIYKTLLEEVNSLNI